MKYYVNVEAIVHLCATQRLEGHQGKIATWSDKIFQDLVGGVKYCHLIHKGDREPLESRRKTRLALL